MAKKEFPAWYYGPKGEAKIFNTAEEVPKGWAKHPDLVGKQSSGGSSNGADDALKEQFERLTGKKAGNKKAETLQAEIEKIQAEHEQFFNDNETSPEEVRGMLMEMDVELPDENDTGALIKLAQEHLVEGDD